MTSPKPIYNSNVPEFPSDSLAKSQPDLIDNFKTLYDSFKVNHIPLDAVSNAGNHSILQLFQQESSPQTDISEISIYTKNIDGQTDQVFLRYQGNGQEIQLTNYQIYSIEDTPTQTTFITFLPGKILLYFGTINLNAATGNLDLVPMISKNVVGMSFCPIGTLNKFKPTVQILKDSTRQFVKSLFLFTSYQSQNPIIPPCYYIVMANI
jgi:hypothetical protein